MKRASFGFWVLLAIGFAHTFSSASDTLNSIAAIICLVGAVIVLELRSNHLEILEMNKKNA